MIVAFGSRESALARSRKARLRLSAGRTSLDNSPGCVIDRHCDATGPGMNTFNRRVVSDSSSSFQIAAVCCNADFVTEKAPQNALGCVAWVSDRKTTAGACARLSIGRHARVTAIGAVKLMAVYACHAAQFCCDKGESGEVCPAA